MRRTILFGTTLALMGIMTLASAQSQEEGCRPKGRSASAVDDEVGRQRPPHPVIVMLDFDEDGVLSSEEIDQAAATLRALDADGDDSLVGEELPRPQRPEPHPGRGGRMHRHGPPPLMDLDTDGDGVVSFEEFSAPVQQHFDDIDGNGDGVIDQEEVAAVRPPHRGPRRARPQEPQED